MATEEELQPTNEILNELRHDILLEAQDAANQGDRSGSLVLNRIVNALTRNIDRRAAREEQIALVPVEDQTPAIQGMEADAAKAAGKKPN